MVMPILQQDIAHVGRKAGDDISPALLKAAPCAGSLSFGAGFERLTELDMTNNTVTSLPTDLPEALPALQVLTLDSCSLNGTLPAGEQAPSRKLPPPLLSLHACLLLRWAA